MCLHSEKSTVNILAYLYLLFFNKAFMLESYILAFRQVQLCFFLFFNSDSPSLQSYRHLHWSDNCIHYILRDF